MQLVEYIRMSTNLQEDSPETQKSIIAEYCQKNGHTVIKTYIDAAISGGSMDKRTALLELLRDAENKLFEGVIVYKYDRAFRNLAEQVVTIQKLRRHNIKIIAVADPNSEGPTGELIVNVLGAVNQFERQLTGQRIYDKNRELKKKGRWTGSGIDPLGYRYDKESKRLIIVEEEAELVRLIFSTYIKEQSISRTTEILQANMFKTKTGQEWTKERVYNVLINPLFAGMQRWGYFLPGKRGKNRDCEVFEGHHEAIISPETFYRAKEILTFNRNHTSYTKTSTSLLGGLLRCGKCGGIVVSNRLIHRGGRTAYLCKERYDHNKDYCTGWHRMAYRIEDAVYEAVLNNIRKANASDIKADSEKSTSDQSSQIKKKIKQLEQKLERQIDMYEEGLIDREKFTSRRTKTLREKEDLEKLLNQNKKADADILAIINNFELLWRGTGMQARKEILMALINIIHTDGEIIKIEFADLGLHGWELVAEVPLK